MLQAAEAASALQPAHVNSGVTEDFTWRTPVRSRIETVREQIAILGHDRHHGRKVGVETQHAQHFAGDSSERACGCKIAVLANRARSRHGREYATQAIDEAAFLVDSKQRRSCNKRARAVEQGAKLSWAGDVAAKDDDAAGLHFLDQGARFVVELSAGKSDE